MADSILRLKVESQEYDAKLKRAADGLQRYADECRKVGGTLEVVEKETLDYVRALGQMDTTSRTATGKLAEMKKTFTELSAQYKQMTDAEKNSPFGKALSASLDQLKGRIRDSKTQLDDINKELGNIKQSGDSAKGGIEGLTSALGINVKSLVGWGAAIGAVKGALDVAKDAFFASEQNLDDWNRTVYSAESVYQGFLTALNTGDISGYLNNINTIVKAASEVYNALDRLGTMKTIDTPQLTAKQSEIQRMQTMLRTGRWVDRADGVKSALGYKTGDVLPKDVLNTIAQQLKSAMGEVAGIMKQEIDAANTAIDALYKEQAAQLGMSNEQFKKGTASMAVFEENLRKAQKYLDFEREHTTSVTSTTSAGIAYTTDVRDNVANPYEQYKNWKVFKDDGDLYQRIVQEIRNRGAAESQYYSQVGQAYRGINRVENVKVGGGSGSGSGTTNVPGSVADLTANIAELRKQQQQVTDFAGWERYEKWIHEITLQVKELKGELGLDAIGNTLGSVKAASISGMAQGYDWAKGREDLIKRGDKQIRSFKGVQQDKTEVIMTKELGKITSGVQGIFSGMEALGVELPQGLKDLMGGVQGVISILSGIATVVSAIQAISTADLIKPLAGGGIVGRAASGLLVGNHMSGDRLRMPVIGGGMLGVNDGELILNKAQQGVVASYMNDGGGGGNAFQPYVSGQYVYLGTNNYLKASGQGELVTTKMLKRYGLV